MTGDAKTSTDDVSHIVWAHGEFIFHKIVFFFSDN